MSELKKIRIGTDVVLSVGVIADGARLDFSATEVLDVIASGVHGSHARCTFSPNAADSTKLDVVFPAGRQVSADRYFIIVVLRSGGYVATFDQPSFELVRTTEEADELTGIVGVEIQGRITLMSVSDYENVESLVNAAVKASEDSRKSAEAAQNVLETIRNDYVFLTREEYDGLKEEGRLDAHTIYLIEEEE